MIEELKQWLHKKRDYYLDRMNCENMERFGPLEREWLDGKVTFCESVLEFIEEKLEPKYVDDFK